MNIPREIGSRVSKSLLSDGQKNPVIVIYGPRQSGKTTFVKSLLLKFSESAVYYSCDNYETQQAFSYEQSGKLPSLLADHKLVVLDEAQRIQNIGLVLKIMVDTLPQIQVIATGSSSFDLSNKIKEPLTGRKTEFLLLPFSYNELRTNNFIENRNLLERMLRYGSYPDVILAQDERSSRGKIEEITGSYLFKDVFTFQDLRKPEILTQLLKLLALQIGSEVSYQELAQKLGVDQTVIQRYIHLLEEAFVVFRLGAFKRNLRNEVVKSRKIYFYDLGVRNALIQNFNSLDLRTDNGFLWENFCILERLKHNQAKGIYKNTYFWRTYEQNEIDYIEEGDGELRAFEFKWNDKAKVKPPKDFLNTYEESTFKTISHENFESFISE